LLSPVTVVQKVTARGGSVGSHSVLVSACWRGGGCILRQPTYREVTSISKHRPLLWTKWRFDHPASGSICWLMHSLCHGIS